MYGTLKSEMGTYLVGFCLMESGPLICGLSYNGTDKDGNEQHDRIQSAVIYKLETSNRVKDFLANWNISCHKWLKYYVFLRLLSNDRKNRGLNILPAFMTFLVSAIWHGFYSGYFVFFIAAGFLDAQEKLAGFIF
jgi:lysophospholipid acyltransferase